MRRHCSDCFRAGAVSAAPGTFSNDNQGTVGDWNGENGLLNCFSGEKFNYENAYYLFVISVLSGRMQLSPLYSLR